MKTSVVGYPRIGASRELKFACESYFRRELSAEDLQEAAAALRKAHWQRQASSGIAFIPSNDFSLYDGILDMAVLLNAVPERYRALHLDSLSEYFAMARGYQGKNGDVKALAMKKWFNTNYHYMVPEIDDHTQIKLSGTKPFDEYLEAKALGIHTKPVLLGIFTFMKLAKFTGSKRAADYTADLVKAYAAILDRMGELGVRWVQFDEPVLVTDQTAGELALFHQLYKEILTHKGSVKVLLQTYFGDTRDCYREMTALDFDGIGIDFAEGTRSLELVQANGLPADKTLFAGIVNGKNIWKNKYAKSLQIIEALKKHASNLVLGTSCSLLHVPYTLNNEAKLSADYRRHFAFAEEKLAELADLSELAEQKDYCDCQKYVANAALFQEVRSVNPAVRAKVCALTASDYTRLPAFGAREKLQNSTFGLPLLPTTTIGSFPQTARVRANRAAYKNGGITEEQYKAFLKKQIADCIALQEEIGLDVLVHGEFERNDMVEYFGEYLDGYLFTEKAWVQSYGTRCVKPPIVWGDISRSKPMTIEYSVYAQSLTVKPVKGMLTGPVTILNWSFPREDIPLQETALQLALAIREEVLELEANGVSIIQIDEAALKEKLPLRKADWHSHYLDWAIPAFRLVHSGVKPQTQIHTHMCYSEFDDIVKEIDEMDADVITFEASRSSLTIIDALNDCHFQTAVGPGVYDIHSPRVPSIGEIEEALTRMLTKLPRGKLWVNPDCGLKTRGEGETVASLQNLVAAAKEVRQSLTT